MPDGTRVAVETIFELRGLMRVIGPLFIGPYERGWDKGLLNLKRMMEAGELNPAPPATDSASA